MLAPRVLPLMVAAFLCTGAMDAADAPPRPRILLIGDSISIGYTDAVVAALRDRAEVVRIPGNGQTTAFGLEHIDGWLGGGRWAVIHANWGLWDLKQAGTEVPLAQYRANLDRLVQRMQQAADAVVLATTTPVPQQNRHGRRDSDVAAYNEAMRAVAAAHGVAVDDLYAAVKPDLGTLQRPNDVHFTPEGYRVLAKQVAACIGGIVAGAAAPATAGRTAPAPAAAGGPIRVLCLGDSNGEAADGWVAQLIARRRDLQITNWSASGMTIAFDNPGAARNMSKVLPERLAQEKTAFGYVVTMLGTNDCKAVFAGRDDTIIAGWSTILRTLHEQPLTAHATVLCVSPPPLAPVADLAAKFAHGPERLAALLPRLLHEADLIGATWIDTHTDLARDTGPAHLRDGIHLTAAAATAVAARVAEAIPAR